METNTSVRLPASVLEEAMAMTGKHTPRAAIAALVKARRPAYPIDDGLSSKKLLKRVAKEIPQDGFPVFSIKPRARKLTLEEVKRAEG